MAGVQRAMTSAAVALTLLALVSLVLAPAPAGAADPTPGPPLTIVKLPGDVTIDGDVTDPAWQAVPVVDTWFETNVGDNAEPQVKNRARLAYDDKFLYAAFEFEDPNPGNIRAPIGDHDAVSGSTDYGGLIIDSRNDAKTARMFLANARGVQYDAVTSDVSGEDSSPDFYWDSAGKITASGWSLEIRVPFSSLRYADTDTPTWGMLMYRNYPRDRRYQFFSARLPRDVNCFICNSSKMTGLASLPQGSHLVVAPFVTASQTAAPRAGLGTSLENEDFEGDGGVDIKWSPASTVALDATINPDFSQVEADAAQIVANERFALFFPEKRPFFLEGVDLFSTPMQAVYTRTITAPSGGLRATGRFGNTSYTVLATQDDGDGVVVVPGPQGSTDVPQDFVSNVGIARVRQDFGQSFVSLLVTDREVQGGGGYNRVFGPDFQWRPNPRDSFTGQVLFSETRTPDRTDLHDEWDGRKLSDVAGLIYFQHATRREDVFVQVQSLGEDFRADDGFIPQVGYSEGYFEAGYTVRPKNFFLNRIRPFTIHYVDIDNDGDVLNQRVSFGTGMDGRWNSFLRYEINFDAIRVGDELLRRFRPRINATAVPGRVVNSLAIDAYFGEEIDFANGREGTGATLAGSFILRPNAPLELRGNLSRRWLNVDEPTLEGRLFTAQVERLRATWAFNSRSFLRLIGQYTETERDPSLYTFDVGAKSATFTGSALFAYKLNWQTVLYAGYGDQHDYLVDTDKLEPSSQQLFTKVSYAWQH